ncbi:MAG: DNAase [Thiobacillus sp. 65-69]|nr:TatD family hydrolase [Thiobacillus sp.]ODU88779.1 MAG: DNAase [Thiobacillus sp. SCN 65-179]OJW39106.1 MAG: DNAase [Thiobacillus sp. 65-69]
MTPAIPSFIDTHSHFDAAEFDADRDTEYARARAAGVDVQIVPSVARTNFDAVATVCAHYSGCLPAWGLHPMYVAAHAQDDLDALRARIAAQRPVAVGEIGLDLFVRGLDVAAQEHFYAEQLKIARDHDLPVLLHCRKSSDLLLKHLRRIRVPGGIAHAFNGSAQQAAAFIKLGFRLGFGGAFTWPRAHHLRRLAAELPLDAIVLETDSPDIPPVWIGRGRNAPGELPRIAAALAELRELDVETVARTTTANARRVLRLTDA